MAPKAVSLFCSGGIGDLALQACGIETLVANELLEERASVFKRNFPSVKMLAGDIRVLRDSICVEAKRQLKGSDLDFLFAPPPCQGMSKNGRGKLLQGIRAGTKPELDERNQLITDVVYIAQKLKPKTIVLENVPEMAATIIESPQGKFVNIIDYLQEALAPQYVGNCKVVEFADYGVPQRRQRLISRP